MQLPTPKRDEPGDAERWQVAFDGSYLIFGAGSLATLGDRAREIGCRRVLLVTDPGIRQAGHVERAVAALESSGIEAHIFDGVAPNPTTRQVDRGVEFARPLNVDGIVGLGGGSALDCAKAINFLLTNGGAMEDYRGTGKATREMLPGIGVPCAAGTGSDAQSYALISEEGTGIKMACGDRKAKFRIVILDPDLTATAPRELVAVGGLDAASHVLESYVCTRGNPVSRMIGREAWRLLDSAFEATLDDPGDARARGRMLVGSHLAGSAIEHSMLGAAHACANPLTARFGVTHGIAVALMLPHVMRFNAERVGERYRELHAVTASGARGESAEERFRALRRTAGLPTTLNECGVPRDSLDQLARDASRQWTAEFNPRPVTTEELRHFYESAYA